MHGTHVGGSINQGTRKALLRPSVSTDSEVHLHTVPPWRYPLSDQPSLRTPLLVHAVERSRVKISQCCGAADAAADGDGGVNDGLLTEVHDGGKVPTQRHYSSGRYSLVTGKNWYY